MWVPWWLGENETPLPLGYLGSRYYTILLTIDYYEFFCLCFLENENDKKLLNPGELKYFVLIMV